MNDDLQQARIEAVSQVFRHAVSKEGWTLWPAQADELARAALAAADAHFPTVEQIAEVVGGIRLDAAECRENYFCDEVVSDHAMDIATAVRALFGEVAGDE